MNVLADRHHADLFYSLQLLGDRLGWTVYTPVGPEWHTEGFWQFEVPWDPGALARQYLTIDANWKPLGGGRYVTYDPHHPERPLFGITLAAFWRMRWAHIIATVQQNQWGFARLAKEVGAKYVLQVGNTGQLIDWSLDPLVLNNSEMPMLGRHVTYHQELESGTVFRYREPAASFVVRSFVNCMPQMGECWDGAERLREALPEAEFRVHGINGPDGNIEPVQRVADLMAASAFGLHDKAHGDGFGHVLHQWAAVGRPLIGHAEHYAGKMGGVFWRDGETCIDLGRRSFDENVALIRAIAADPGRHERMCRAIRAVFDEHVDYAAEAAAIRALLEG